MNSRTLSRRGAIALVAAGALATSGLASAASGTMPAAPPSDAGQAGLSIFTTTVPKAKLGGPAASYLYTTNGGGQVRIGKVVNRGFTDFQTITVTPPSGGSILQGFATVSGGNTGSMVIRSTQTARGRYTVRLAFPGEQGTPGRLTIRFQVENQP